jgi:hypothetical protein
MEARIGRASVFAPLFAGVLVCAGCFSLTSFQSPEVLRARHASFGAGLNMSVAGGSWAGDFSPYPWPEIDLMARYGLGRNVDIGGKITGPWASGAADVKWQFLRRPLLMAFGFGGSYGDYPGNYEGYWSVYPELFLGSHRVFCAARAVRLYELQHEQHGTYVDGQWMPIFSVGGSFGGKFRVMPELSVRMEEAYTDGKLQPVPGIGVAFQYTMGKDENDQDDAW